jgi:hypothetical protein
LFYLSNEEKALKTVHKYQLAQRGVSHSLYLPVGSQVLHVDVQSGSQYVWVFVDWSQPANQQYEFLIVGTGEIVPDEYWPVRTLSAGLTIGDELHAFLRMPVACRDVSDAQQEVANV